MTDAEFEEALDLFVGIYAFEQVSQLPINRYQLANIIKQGIRQWESMKTEGGQLEGDTDQDRA